jgi:hypothetical protein
MLVPPGRGSAAGAIPPTRRACRSATRRRAARGSRLTFRRPGVGLDRDSADRSRGEHREHSVKDRTPVSRAAPLDPADLTTPACSGALLRRVAATGRQPTYRRRLRGRPMRPASPAGCARSHRRSGARRPLPGGRRGARSHFAGQRRQGEAALVRLVVEQVAGHLNTSIGVRVMPAAAPGASPTGSTARPHARPHRPRRARFAPA